MSDEDMGMSEEVRRYPVVKVTELQSLFQKQRETGEWGTEALELVHLNTGKFSEIVKATGCKSLGETINYVYSYTETYVLLLCCTTPLILVVFKLI